MNPFEKNAFDYSQVGKVFSVPMEGFNPGLALMQQWAGAMTRANLEVAGFWSRRTRACFDAPRRLASCRTLQDVTALQSELATATLRDATETAARTSAAFVAPIKAASQAASQQPTNGSAGDRAEAKRSGASGAGAKPETTTHAYEWWRTDMKAIMPRRNGHADEGTRDRAGT